MSKYSFEYKGHIWINAKLCMIYHGIENNCHIFTLRDIVDNNSPQLNKGYFSCKYFEYKPKKVYKSTKGEFVRLGGFRYYFKDFKNDYSDISEYIQ